MAPPSMLPRELKICIFKVFRPFKGGVHLLPCPEGSSSPEAAVAGASFSYIFCNRKETILYSVSFIFTDLAQVREKLATL